MSDLAAKAMDKVLDALDAKNKEIRLWKAMLWLAVRSSPGCKLSISERLLEDFDESEYELVTQKNHADYTIDIAARHKHEKRSD